MTSAWIADHPWRFGALVMGCAVLGMLAGVGTAWAMTSTHLLSPDNIWAGAGWGFGGAMAGGAAGFTATWRVSARYDRKTALLRG